MRPRDVAALVLLVGSLAGAVRGAESAWSRGTFPIEKPQFQKGWAAQAIEPGRWTPVEQPDLGEELKSAPKLKLVNVAPPPERCWVGHQPWHLVAFNVKTHEGRLLATSRPGERGRCVGLTRMKGGIRGTMSHPASVHGLDDFDKDELKFWLHDGDIYKREGEVPPWSDAPAARDRSGTYRWAREFQRWGDFAPKTPPPEFKKDGGDPDPSGRVELPYRLPGEEKWRTLKYDVTMYPGTVRRLRLVRPGDRRDGGHALRRPPRLLDGARLRGALHPPLQQARRRGAALLLEHADARVRLQEARPRREPAGTH